MEEREDLGEQNFHRGIVLVLTVETKGGKV